MNGVRQDIFPSSPAVRSLLSFQPKKDTRIKLYNL